MTQRINLTDARIARIEPPAKGELLVHDTAVPELKLRVLASGSMTFLVYKRMAGSPRPKKVTICKVGQLPLNEVRKRAQQIVADLLDGIDPTDDKRKSREAATLGTLWAKYSSEKELETSFSKQRSWALDKSRYNRFLKQWSARKLTDIQPHMIIDLKIKVGNENGKVAANRLLALLKIIFNYARDLRDYAEINPVSSVTFFPERPRDRHLKQDELDRLSVVLDNFDNQMFSDYFRVALYTGQRRGNLTAMRFDELDLDSAAPHWTISAESAKGKRTLVIPLIEPAAIILKRRLADSKLKEFVFPSWGKTGHLDTLRHAWARVCKLANIDKCNPHDLRHTTASIMIKAGIDLYAVGQVLGHRTLATTARYSHLIDPTKRNALSKVADSFPLVAPAQPENKI